MTSHGIEVREGGGQVIQIEGGDEKVFEVQEGEEVIQLYTFEEDRSIFDGQWNPVILSHLPCPGRYNCLF